MIHGTESAYARHNCRCDECKHGRYLRTKRYRSRRRTGDVLVDATPAIEHLRQLEDEGFGVVPMLKLIGWRGNGRRLDSIARIHRRYEVAILNMTRDQLLADLPDLTLVPAIGAQRRIRALQAIGWPHDLITPGAYTARNTCYASRRLVTARVHRLIGARFEELCMTPGPSVSAARCSDHVTPLMWDDIDDPAATSWKAPVYGIRSAIDPDDVEHLLDADVHPQVIAARLGVQYDSIVQQLRRIGEHDLLRRLIRARQIAS